MSKELTTNKQNDEIIGKLMAQIMKSVEKIVKLKSLRSKGSSMYLNMRILIVRILLIKSYNPVTRQY